MKIKTGNVVIDEKVYPRNGIDHFHLKRMTLAYESGAKFPPIVIDASTKRLVEGRHRLQMFLNQGIGTIEVVAKSYASDADLFADAVRLNVGHGLPLDQYEARNSIIRLEQYGFKKDEIAEIVRIPVTQIMRIEAGFASTQKGKPLALKGGLSHLRGQSLTDKQQAVNRKYGGGKATFHARQLRILLEADMWPTESAAFINEMNRLTDAWSRIQKADDKAA